jgi:hypothetical protein
MYNLFFLSLTTNPHRSETLTLALHRSTWIETRSFNIRVVRFVPVTGGFGYRDASVVSVGVLTDARDAAGTNVAAVTLI